ncbi:MAG TPA: IclR family transcriptional regulator [Microvirga sp.]|nr:IclR family transcriptional regulator [Microvirga sp.]
MAKAPATGRIAAGASKRPAVAAPAGGESGRGGAAKTADDRQFVTALARGLEVLRAFKPNDGLLGNQDIAARTGLPKPTVSRLTHTLTRLGYLTHIERLAKYQLAPGALSIGYAALANFGIREIARPHMQALADEAGAAVAFGGRDRNSMIYLAQCRASTAFTVRLEVGSRIPMATTAMGRAYLAAIPGDERAEIMDAIQGRFGTRWPEVRAGIERAVDEVARHGFTISAGDWQPDVYAVGAPLAAADGSGIFAFNCGAPAYGLTRDRLQKDLGPRLVALVRTTEAVLNGGRQPAQDRPYDPRGGPVAEAIDDIRGEARRPRDRRFAARR